jgi:hypothetical protein
MEPEYVVGNLRIAAAPGWLDVTGEIEASTPPFTLAKSDGVGALQFSVAEYDRGRLPDIRVDDLKKLLTDFALSRELGSSFDFAIRETPLLTCAQSYGCESQFLRVWYCSDGRNVVLATYVCAKGMQETELGDCEKMIESLAFV